MRVSIPEASRVLRISEHTVRRRLHSGELEGVQVASSGGFSWMVELPDESPLGEPDGTMHRLVDNMQAQIDTLTQELESRRREVQELHVLLQQAQAALPAPREGKSWWRGWWRH